MTPDPPWHCPQCDLELEHPRTMAVGCMPKAMPIGECPMHRTIIAREAWATTPVARG